MKMKTKTIYGVMTDWTDEYVGYYETYDLAYQGAKECFAKLDLEDEQTFEDVFSVEMGIEPLTLVVSEE